MSEKDLNKKDIRNFWNKAPCGIKTTHEREGTKEFFEEIEEYRYKEEACIHKAVGFEKYKGKKILEVGCGIGTDLSQFAKNGGIVYGIDLTSKGINLAKIRCNIFKLDADLMVADAENLPFKDNFFDLVYSSGVLHHTPNTHNAINEIYRVLKPKGNTIVMLYHKSSVNYYINILIIARLMLKLIRHKRGLQIVNCLAKLQPNLLLNIELIKQYQELGNKNPNLSNKVLLNNTTDGPCNPLSKVYTQKEVKNIFKKYENVKTEVYYLGKIPIIGVFIPCFLSELVGRRFGWFLYTKANKPETNFYNL